MDSGERVRTALVCAALFALTAVVYGVALARVPPYLAHDEVAFSLNAHAIASTGRDVNGRRFPLFFEFPGQFWATPVAVYATAALLTVAPLAETTIRAPSVAAGALDVVLVFAIALRIFRSRRIAAVAAVLLALTPAHLIHSRIASDLIYPVPLLLGSILAWVMYAERRDLRLLFVAASLQGIGCYAYIGAMIAMPLYFGLACLLLVADIPVRRGRSSLRLPALRGRSSRWFPGWCLTRRNSRARRVCTTYTTPSIRRRCRGSIAPRLGQLHVARGRVLRVLQPAVPLRLRDASIMNSTRTTGVFLLPMAVFLPVGLNRLLARDRTAGSPLVAAGVLLAPVAALVVLEVKVNRALVMLPFAAMAAAAGVDTMLRARRPVWRYAAAALLVAVPLQFASFYRDYLTDYRSRAAFWFEQNKRGAFEEILARDRESPIPAIYISRTPRWIDWYWKWYLAKAGRPDLLQRTVYTVPGELHASAMAPHSVVFGEVEEVERAPIFTSDARKVARILEPNGTTSFIVFER